MERLTDTKQLGALIRETRKDQGMTQEKLAAICGVGVRFVRELENGKESCHLAKSLLVSYMLGIHILMKRGDI